MLNQASATGLTKAGCVESHLVVLIIFLCFCFCFLSIVPGNIIIKVPVLTNFILVVSFDNQKLTKGLFDSLLLIVA